MARSLTGVAGSLVETSISAIAGLGSLTGAPLRYAPSLWHWPTKSRHPAMVALIETHDGTPVTSHATFLSHDGRKADDRAATLFRRRRESGRRRCLVHRLGSKRELIIAEGIESALSAAILYDAGRASRLYRRTACARSSSRRRCGWRCGSSPTTIAPDTASAAARDLYRRLRSEGREVRHHRCRTPSGHDANDVLLRRMRA